MLVVKGLARRKEVGTVDVFVVRGNRIICAVVATVQHHGYPFHDR